MLIDVQDEWCGVYATKRYSVIQNVILKALGSHTNINRPCPMNPGVYYIKDYNFRMNDIPSIIPGRYILNVTVHGQSKKFMAYWAVYFHVTNYGLLDLSVG